MISIKNIFEKILGENISRGRVVGVDIGSSSIKVVELKKEKGMVYLETYGELALGPYFDLPVGSIIPSFDSQIISKALNDVLKEAEVTTRNSTISLSAVTSLIFILEIPGIIQEKELTNIVPLEARKYIPIPISEVSLDWWPVPFQESYEGEKQTKTEILVAAIHNEIMQKYQDIFALSKFEKGIFEIEVFSLIRSLTNFETGNLAIVDLGASKTKIIISENGIIRKFHAINRGGVDITNSIKKKLDISFEKAEESKKEQGLEKTYGVYDVSEIIRLNLDFIFSEVQDIISTHERKRNKPISKIILTGGGAMIKGIVDFASQTFNIPVIQGNSFSRVIVPEFIAKPLEKISQPFSVAVGLALRGL